MPQNESSRHLKDMERNQSKESHSTISINKDGATRESVHNKSNLENNRLTVNVPSLNASDLKINSIGSKVKMMKAASLFDSQRDMDIDGGAPPPNVSRIITYNILNIVRHKIKQSAAVFRKK